MQTILALFIILLFLLLIIHFFYTIIAIFKGAAFIPCPKEALNNLIKITDFNESDTLIDLGSGDGRILIKASKAGAGKCIGIELNPLLVIYSKLKVLFLGLKNIQIKRADIWKTDLSKANIITLYFVPIKMSRLIEKINKEMPSGSKIISYKYKLDDLEFEKEIDGLYLYIKK
jgi:hypothetical protein